MRSSRLLSILLRLQLRGRCTAADLAAEFEVAVRTIYRDLDSLSAAGVPVHAERGRGGGIVLAAGWRTTLTGLTDQEARSLPMAGLASAMRDVGWGVEAADVQLKLLASLPPHAAADAGRIAERFHVDPLPWYHQPEALPLLPELAQAVWEARRVRVVYESWVERQERTLSPLGLVLKGGLWYLVACADGRAKAGAVRTYRVSSIVSLRVLAAAAQRPAAFSLAAHWPASVAEFEARLMSGRATVRLSPEGLEILRATQPAAAAWALRTAVPLQGGQKTPGWITAELPTESEAYAARQLLRLGTEVEVLAPVSLRAAVAQEAAEVARLHRTTSPPPTPSSPAPAADTPAWTVLAPAARR